MFGLFSSFLRNRWFWVVLDGKSSQEYPISSEVPQGSIFGPALCLPYINDLPALSSCMIFIHSYSYLCWWYYSLLCDQASGLWKQLELASELESVLRNTVDWDKKWSGFNGKISMLENLSWYITFINKIASTKFGVFILSLKFLSSEVGLYLYNLYTSLHSTLLSYLNWCSQLLLRYLK